MQKRVLVLVMFLMIILAGFVSAAAFSLSDALGDIQEGTLLILLVFVISFALLFLALNRAFKDNVPIAAVISFALSFGITYWVNKSGFDLSGWVYDIGISSEILSILIPILAIALAIFLIAKLKRNSLFVFGGFLLASSLFVYEKAIVIVLGIILILFRLFIGRGKWERRRYPWERPFDFWRDRYSNSRYPNSFGDSPYLDTRKERYKKEKGNVGRWERARRERIRKRDLAELTRKQNERIRRDKEEKQAEEARKFEERERREYEKSRRHDRRRREEERKQAEEERKYEKGGRRQAEEEKKYEKRERKQERLQITSNLQSLKRTYNEIQRTDPSDPRLRDLIKEIKRIRKNK